MNSLHAEMRIKERAGFGVDTAEKMSERAWNYGKIYIEYSGREREYLKGKSINNSIAVCYGGYIYIFTIAGLCITMYQVPSWFGKKDYYECKKIVRNPKKYYTRYCVYADAA